MEDEKKGMNLDPQWIVGFVDGEGCFFVGFNKNAEMQVLVQVLPEFTVVQHHRDIALLHAMKNHFQCGVVRRNHGDRWAYRVRGYSNLKTKIVPFFEKHQLKSKKRVDFEKFRDIVRLMDSQQHLTFEGLAKIQAIASQMNRKALSFDPKIESSSF